MSRGQFAAIAQLRWHMFAHFLRTARGKLELLSRVMVGLVFSIGALGGAVGLGSTAWYFVSDGKTEWLAALLWSVFAFWQMFPVMAIAFTENLESSDLLRFPLNYITYFLLRLVYGSMDLATLLPSTWLLGITIGIGFAKLSLLPWTILVLATFAAVNILLSRMIFAWLERWLTRRRTREFLGVVFFLTILSFQFIGPLVGRYYEQRNSLQTQRMHELSGVQRTLPPGLTAAAIDTALRRKLSSSLTYFLLLGAYGAAFLYFLNVRLRAQYRGENSSEAGSPGAAREQDRKLRLGWTVPGFSEAISAVFEKELRYLSRSAPMLFTLIMPPVMLLVFRMGPAGNGHGFLERAPELALPIGAAYTLLIMTNLVYNNFGLDGGGIQLFFGAPVRFREVVMGKNLAHLAVVALEMLLVWIGVYVIYAPPTLAVTITTIAGLAFAAPLNFFAGNLLSVYSPKKIEHGTFGRQRASMTTVLASFAVQLLIVGLGALAIFVSRRYGMLWIAGLVFAVLAAFSISGYFLVLNRVDGMVARHQETMISELCKI